VTTSGLRARMRAARAAVTSSDSGMTLPEVLISSILMAVVGSLCVGVVVNVSGGSGKTDNDLRGLQEMRTLQERLSRDLLQARGVTSGSTTSQLTLWIDGNGDYVQTDAELYRWQVAPPGSGPRRQVQRVNVGTGVTEVVARSVVSGTAFAYKVESSPGVFVDATSQSAATVVDVDLTYNPGVGAQNKPRNLKFSTRMRNHA
jgi:type II secretory pathway pseudopilin PulG